ncbi:nucleotidyl transferase AbiEii/AbiGii toxin family protein [uncultured Cytophaga sp.]|uniref:nucleotidyl transferase AbiEii/AbiGii toxin family protein n=1 Tax=uncultured Cytophaga sp. TaxID=160238 RepID=UPI00260EA46F|nr:nucleotidyl transferase AbiEii/AbiGii toxin family protein [uncultured Cytophaga sp.]
MIDKVSLSEQWLEAKRIKYAKDPSIIESMIYALYLLEQLKQTELDFIFKGGTSLLLLLEKPARFSVDIDIIVSPTIDKEKLESYLIKIAEGSSFIRMELDERRSYKIGVPKAHYKFIYKSNAPTKNKNEVIENPEREILLDVLFAENPYPVVIDKPIVTEWIKIDGETLLVKMPCVNSITGDKLTAYAPNTVGVPYQVGKEKEIIKQLFDISTLFELIDDIELVKQSFGLTAVEEIKYRAKNN